MKINIYKIFLLTVVALLQLTACKDDNDSAEEVKYIQFGRLVVEQPSSPEDTRGAIIEGKDGGKNYHGNISLYGLYSGTTYISENNLEVKDGYLETAYPWPAGNKSLSFYAFAPAASGENLTVSPSNTALNCEVKYTLPTESNNQKDLLFGEVGPCTEADTDLTGALSFKFQHVLSRITFRAEKAASITDDVIITSIKINKAMNTLGGTLATGTTFAWEAIEGSTERKDYTFALASPNNKAIADDTADETKKITFLKNGDKDFSLFMFPHTVAQFTNDGTNRTQLEIKYTIGSGDDQIFTEYLDDHSAANGNYFWEMGQWINYVIKFKDKRVYFEAHILDWDDTYKIEEEL
ncbi:fimbrillin family protein [Bacteroides sp. 224]|uniref:fimbrillin family protein n=1 Tax=Bacteroides sp. 224 TaxID=2302936 RepID=UPI0013D56A27|nr:fimbrillin family protein [Bacteroides sp. 224]